MPWAGGSYTKGNNGTGGWVGDASLGIGIEAGRHDTQDNDFATGINQCLNKDGSNSATANLNLGGFRYTNAGAATARTDLPQVAQVQDGDFIWLGTTGGTATAQTASTTPSLTAYKAGQKFRGIIGSGLNSTGQTPNAHTININGLGAKDITNNDNTNLTAGSFVAGHIIELVYDGTRFKKTNETGGWQNWTPTLSAPIGSVSSVNIVTARYKKVGKVAILVVYVSCSASSVGPQIEITNPPIALVNGSPAHIISPCFTLAGGVFDFGYVYNNSTTNIAFTKNPATSNIGSGTVSARFTFTYEAQ